MNNFNVNRGLIGSKTLLNDLFDYDSLNEKQLLDLRFKLKVIDHERKFGLASAIDAFSVPKRTIFRWKKKIRESRGDPYSLVNKSRRPKNVRKSKIPENVLEFIKREKIKRRRIGKVKLAVMVEQQLGYIISASSVGRIINNLKDRGILKPYKRTSYRKGKVYVLKHRKNNKKTRIKGYKPSAPGELIQVDSIVLNVLGKRWYIVTAIDILTRRTWAVITKSHSSKPTAALLKYLRELFKDVDMHIQTDNGSEFYKHFEEACKQLKIVHFWNYPRSPKMNTFVERFNRTLKEEFVNEYKHFLINSPEAFNEEMQKYLRWYNHVRPHWSLDLTAPMVYTKKHY